MKWVKPFNIGYEYVCIPDIYIHRPRNHISAKVIDYNDQVIRVREYLLFRGIPSPMYFQLSRKRQCIASFPANVYNLSLKRLQPLPQTFAVKRRLLWNPFPSCFSAEHKIGVQPKCRLAVSHGAVIKKRKCQP